MLENELGEKNTNGWCLFINSLDAESLPTLACRTHTQTVCGPMEDGAIIFDGAFDKRNHGGKYS